jgi:hypothetical protein
MRINRASLRRELAEFGETRACQPVAKRGRPRQRHVPDILSIPALATTIKARWVCEQAHQQMKEELGLDQKRTARPPAEKGGAKAGCWPLARRAQHEDSCTRRY